VVAGTVVVVVGASVELVVGASVEVVEVEAESPPRLEHAVTSATMATNKTRRTNRP